MTALLSHYVAVALAKFRKAPFTTAANVATLALGLACFMAAWGIADWWRSSDSHHRNADRTVVVAQAVTLAGAERPGDLLPRSSATVARYLRQDFPELDLVARVRSVGDHPIAAGDRKTLLDAAYVEPELASVFDFDFVEGDARAALTAPGGVVLTQDGAARLFGGAPALGRSVRVDGRWDGVVTGVIAPVRQPSFMGSGPGAALPFDMLTNWSNHPAAGADTDAQWFVPIIHTFVVLPDGMGLATFNARLQQFAAARIPSDPENGFSATLRALPAKALATFTLDALVRGRSSDSFSAFSVLIGLGVLTLAIACVNYANLATAQAASHVKEIGMRKTLGAGRAQVMAQAWVEATMAALAATLVALLALALAAPLARTTTGVDILHFLRSGTGASVLVALVLGAAVLAGLYPALVLSGVRPIQALQAGRARGGPQIMARILVGVQFASASFLLILVIVTQGQRAHLERTALAPRQDPVLILADVSRRDVDYDTLAARLRALPDVVAVSVADKPPLGVAGANIIQLGRSPEAGTSSPAGYFRAVDLDYFAAFNLPVLAGRVFDAARNDTALDMATLSQTPQTPPMVIDRVYAQRLGFATPEAAVDQVVYLPASMTDNATAQPARIIGVTESEPAPLQSGAAEGTAYFFAPRVPFGGQRPMVRITGEDVPRAIADVTRVWDEMAPDIPVDIRFFDELFETSFKTYARVGQLFMLLAGSAFVIASIGLLGMAAHVASRRRHEIGVRKTLGSTTLGIVRLLLIDFSRPVLIANLLAWPLGYLAAQTYLACFADRMALTPAPFALSMAVTLLIAVAAVIGEVLKAASVRPAEVLRHA